MFKPRLTKPEKGNKYYNTKSNGGYSTAIVGKPTDYDCNVLANCVGYEFGRFNEIAENIKMSFLAPVNAENFYETAKKQGLKVGQTPRFGACMCWQKGPSLDSSDGAGHVASVEKVVSNLEVVTSESGYGASNPFWTQTRNKGSGNWGQSSDYKFLGFIYNPGPYEEPTHTVREGDFGESVKWLQWQLAQMGYMRDTEIDGHFGKITLGAVCAFQLENGLSVDGICGPKTRSAL